MTAAREQHGVALHAALRGIAIAVRKDPARQDLEAQVAQRVGVPVDVELAPVHPRAEEVVAAAPVEAEAEAEPEVIKKGKVVDESEKEEEGKK